MNTIIIQKKLCNFIDIGFNKYKCQNCGIIVTSDDGSPILPCSYDFADMRELQNIGMASTLSVIEGRYELCKTCEFFDNNSCSKCGCKVVSFMEFKNKLIWKDQECPIGRWGKDI